jgi:hypothetical protein
MNSFLKFLGGLICGIVLLAITVYLPGLLLTLSLPILIIVGFIINSEPSGLFSLMTFGLPTLLYLLFLGYSYKRLSSASPEKKDFWRGCLVGLSLFLIFLVIWAAAWLLGR